MQRSTLKRLPASSPARTLAMQSADSLSRIEQFSQQAIQAYERYRQSRDLAQLQKSIDALRDAVTETPLNDPRHACFLSDLGGRLGVKFLNHTQDAEDIEEAVVQAEAAVTADLIGGLRRAAFLHNLGCILEWKFATCAQSGQETSAIRDRIIAVQEEVHSITGRADPLGLIMTHCLARYTDTGNSVYIEKARYCDSQFERDATMPESARRLYQGVLGDILRRCYERTGNEANLAESLVLARAAVGPNLSSDSHELESQLGLVAILSRCYQKDGSAHYLEEGINTGNQLQTAALKAGSSEVHLSALNNLGRLLYQRCGLVGGIGDLFQAIEWTQQAVNGCRYNDTKADRLNSLANLYGRLYERTTSLGDLGKAIFFSTEALKTFPQSLNRAMYLNNLGMWLGFRYEGSKDEADLDEAIAKIVEAVEAVGEQNLDYCC